tara:strand:- start:1874 stop:2059 length:186 start_codon:yes stop_codon:yes gene_type:complete
VAVDLPSTTLKEFQTPLGITFFSTQPSQYRALLFKMDIGSEFFREQQKYVGWIPKTLFGIL